MRIGLLRHFKVDCPHKKMMTSQEFLEWSRRYDISQVIKTKVEMNGVEWDVCYVSDMPRAIITAKEVYKGSIIIDKLLREVDNAPFINTKRIKLPFALWHICGRIAWYLKLKSQPENKEETRKRIYEFLDRIDWSKENILIVFHGFMIYNFQKELRKLGFKGDKLKKVKNGVLYEYIKENEKEDMASESLSDLCG